MVAPPTTRSDSTCSEHSARAGEEKAQRGAAAVRHQQRGKTGSFLSFTLPYTMHDQASRVKDTTSLSLKQTAMTLNERFRILKMKRMAAAQQNARGGRFVTVG